MILPRHLAVAAALVAAPLAGAAQDSPGSRCGLRVPASERRGLVGLPNGDVFCPLIADPKGMRSFISYLAETTRGDSLATIGSVGVADAFGLVRWGGSGSGNGVQLSLEGAIFAQFDLDTPSFDLINADYIVGIPLAMRVGHLAGRFRLYHQSSHLGDEYLLRQDPDRENLTFEAFEAILSLDAGGLRVYAGGELLMNRQPSSLERRVAHGGIELRPGAHFARLPVLGTVRLVAGGDFKASEEQGWDPSVSVRAGLEFDRRRASNPPARRWSVLLESYTGPSPYGQFFRNRIQYIGTGFHFQL